MKAIIFIAGVLLIASMAEGFGFGLGGGGGGCGCGAPPAPPPCPAPVCPAPQPCAPPPPPPSCGCGRKRQEVSDYKFNRPPTSGGGLLLLNNNAPSQSRAPMAGRGVVLFDQSKNEQFNINSGLRNMLRKLKNTWKIESNTGEIRDDMFDDCRVFVIPAPRAKFTQSEFESIRRFISIGGSVLVLMSEGGESKNDTNINFLLEEFGIMVNSDSVIRTIFYKYFHPKEALVSNGVLNRSLAHAAGKVDKGSLDDDENHAQALSFVYPFGATLNVNRQSTPVLSTGSVCYPINRPICAFHSHKDHNGKLVVVGSVHMFTDQYLDKDENLKVLDVIFQFLTNDLALNAIDASDPEISDNHSIPDHLQLASQLKVCLQEGEVELPTRDLIKLFDGSLHAMDLAMLPKCMRAFELLQLKHEPLTLISPQFEIPLPPLQPADDGPIEGGEMPLFEDVGDDNYFSDLDDYDDAD
uniref:ABC-type uncharacterized transport system domain-containing protein n=1 Tax=Plectus sambesii TaxID=2011161 RepID=A0A914VES4_9BILA